MMKTMIFPASVDEIFRLFLAQHKNTHQSPNAAGWIDNSLEIVNIKGKTSNIFGYLIDYAIFCSRQKWCISTSCCEKN